jgi:hypothetical protein
MPNIYTTIVDAAPALLEGCMTVLERRRCTKRCASSDRVGAWRSLTVTTPRARWRRVLETRWTPVPRRFGHILSMIRGWCGASRGSSKPLHRPGTGGTVTNRSGDSAARRG